MSDNEDYNLAVLLKGKNPSGESQTIQVDTDGKLFAVLKALYSGSYTDLVCDANGNLKMDLAVQTLGYTTSRATHGSGQFSWGSMTVDPNAETSLVNVTGKGKIYTATVFCEPSATVISDVIQVYVDGNELIINTWEFLNKYGLNDFGDYGVVLPCFDEVNNRYFMNMNIGVTFETSFEITYVETYGRTPTIYSRVVYGIMP